MPPRAEGVPRRSPGRPLSEWQVLSALAYAFGAAVTASWTVGIQGFGRDRFDRFGLALVVLAWPIAWLLAAGAALANFRGARR